MKSSSVLVGDIVMSPAFKNGYKWAPYFPITEVGCSESESNCTDQLRTSKKYVVISAELEYESPVKNGWSVIARELLDGQYSEEGELIKFYQSGDFKNVIPVVEVVGKLKMSDIKHAKIKIKEMFNAKDADAFEKGEMQVVETAEVNKEFEGTVVDIDEILSIQKKPSVSAILDINTSRQVDLNRVLYRYEQEKKKIERWVSRADSISVPPEIISALQYYIEHVLTLKIKQVNEYIELSVPDAVL